MRQPITPYLTVRDAAGAIAFYQKAFGATENMRMPAEDGKRLMHADLTINGGKIYLSDEFPEHDSVAAPDQGQRPPVAMALAFAQPAEVDAMFARATQAGARAALPPGDMFWGELCDAAGPLRPPLDVERSPGEVASNASYPEQRRQLRPCSIDGRHPD